MHTSRFKLSALAALIAAASGLASLPHDAHASGTATTTLSSVITGADQHTLHGYRKLVSQQLESSRVVRTIDGSAMPQNLKSTQKLLAFGHMSDTQICDDQSPARVPFMDKRADIDAEWDTNAAYRPQERLLAQMGTAMVSSLRNLGAAPATSLPLAFTLITGDMVDNAQYNETRTYIDMMDGGLIRPNNWANPAVEEGPGYGGNNTFHKYNHIDFRLYDPNTPSAYYHPNANGGHPDWYKQYDFPRVPDLLGASRRNFTSPGLGMPWFAAFGNHDMAIQGNLPPDLTAGGDLDIEVGRRAKSMATGNTRIREVDAPWHKPSGARSWLGVIGNFLLDPNPFHTGPATADPNRRILSKEQFMDQHFVTRGWPVGHGFNSTGKPYYVMPPSGMNDRVKFIALDTTNENEFGSQGWIDDEQWGWLVQELNAASTRYWADGHGWITNPAGKDQLIVLYGHHTLDSMENVSVRDDRPLGRSGTLLRELLLRYPNVVMLVNGHTHANSIKGHWVNRPGDGKRINGFWEVTSPAAADFPVQSRIIEMELNSNAYANGNQLNNYLSIYTTMLDIDAPASVDQNAALSDFRKLASIGRELAFNDPGDLSPAKPRGWRAGQEADRNTRLILPLPFPMNDFGPVQGERGTHIVTQHQASRDVKIHRLGVHSYVLSTLDIPAASLQNSEVIATGQFTQGLKMGQDLVLRDADGNIRIKLLDWHLNETPYPGFGDAVRGTVAAATTLGGVGDFDADGRSDLLWRRGDGLPEIWFSGSAANRKALDYNNDNDRVDAVPGEENWNIAGVGDFNADGYADVMFEHALNHTLATRFLRGATRIGDGNPSHWPYANGYERIPGAALDINKDRPGHELLYRKRGGSNDGMLMMTDGNAIWSSTISYDNAGYNAVWDWSVVALGDLNVDGGEDVLFRYVNGSYVAWHLDGYGRYRSETMIDIPNQPEWQFRGLLRNTMTIIY